MITITLPASASAHDLAAVNGILEHYALHQPNFGGATFRVERGDAVAIDADGEIRGEDLATLFSTLVNVLAMNQG